MSDIKDCKEMIKKARKLAKVAHRSLSDLGVLLPEISGNYKDLISPWSLAEDVSDILGWLDDEAEKEGKSNE